MFLFIRVMRRENTYVASSMSNSSVVVCTRSQMFPSCAASWFKMCYKALRSRLTSQVRRSPISLRYSQEQRPFPHLKASCSLGGAFLFDLRGDFSSNQFCIGLSGIFSSTGLPNESHETILQYILRQLQQDLLR